MGNFGVMATGIVAVFGISFVSSIGGFRRKMRLQHGGTAASEIRELRSEEEEKERRRSA